MKLFLCSHFSSVGSLIKEEIENKKVAFIPTASLREGIIYSECYGPEYHGLPQILKWFSDWNIKGTVLKWEIKKFIHQGLFTVVEWYFECDYNNEISGFDGVSIIEFNKNMKIINLKEFQSKSEHDYPYE